MDLWQAIHFVRVEHLTSVAQHAEELGFAGVAFGDHLLLPVRRLSAYPYSEDGSVALPSSAPFPDPWVAMSAMAAATSTLRFSTHVYILPLRDPFTVAKAVATASLLSQGRVELGIGVGWLAEEFAAAGVDFATRGRRTDEMVAVMRALWSGQPVSYSGEFYDLDEIELSPAPARPIPILVGGHSEAALRRAAGLDGWIGLRLPHDERTRLVARLQALLPGRPATGAGFQIVVAMEAGFDSTEYRRLNESGVTAVVAPPMAIDTSVSEWKAEMERTAMGFRTAQSEARP